MQQVNYELGTFKGLLSSKMKGQGGKLFVILTHKIRLRADPKYHQDQEDYERLRRR
jgi:hypothetical protein